jgi:hypothetical protein
MTFVGSLSQSLSYVQDTTLIFYFDIATKTIYDCMFSLNEVSISANFLQTA